MRPQTSSPMASKVIPIPEGVYEAFNKWRVDPRPRKTPSGYYDALLGEAYSHYKYVSWDGDSALYTYLKQANTITYWDKVDEFQKVQAYLTKHESAVWHALPSESARFKLVQKVVKARADNPGMQVAIPVEGKTSFDPLGSVTMFTTLIIPAELPE